ncbi:hypothetical protein HYC85_015008 [Camellia sinensis]|uniref:Protein kinase domain-containing protein n=1 Tax=Camellia sinensis TaxID=4442 RepID=A0A7J7H9Y4_CAMSI|nr:hypothetical protein HYC85_015008 [Camellia sinensis]
MEAYLRLLVIVHPVSLFRAFERSIFVVVVVVVVVVFVVVGLVLKAKGAKMELSITQPDDWHLHLRDGDLLEAVISHSAFHFGRGIVMPNLKPPIKTTAAVVAYQESILKTLPANSDFIPLMTLYLTDTTTPEEIELASEYYLQYNLHSDSLLGDSGVVYAVKLYPAGATTNSQDGVTDLFGKCLPVLEEMVKHNMPLLLLQERKMNIMRDACPSNIGLKVSGKPMILGKTDLVHGEATDPEVDIFDRERMLLGLSSLAVKDSLQQPSCRNILFLIGIPFFKEDCSHTVAAFHFEAFLKAGALDKLEAFTSFSGPDFYGLPRNTSKIKLIKSQWKVPESLSYATGEIIPMFAGETLEWLPSSDLNRGLKRIGNWGITQRDTAGTLEKVDDSLAAFKYRDIRIVAKNFSKKLGEGGFGTVFKGTLPNSIAIAVKMLKSLKQGEKQFCSEISTIGMIQHINLVRLRGFCIQGTKRFLVYDYMSNGSLESHLFKKDNINVLHWKTRLEGNGDVEDEEVIRACKVAAWCIQDDEKDRPSMAQVGALHKLSFNGPDFLTASDGIVELIIRQNDQRSWRSSSTVGNAV